MGNEFFGKLQKQFYDGAESQGVPKEATEKIWNKMCTFGSWAFNKSHSVSYALIAYWTMLSTTLTFLVSKGRSFSIVSH